MSVYFVDVGDSSSALMCEFYVEADNMQHAFALAMIVLDKEYDMREGDQKKIPFVSVEPASHRFFDKQYFESPKE